jgi:hypothetical protein
MDTARSTPIAKPAAPSLANAVLWSFFGVRKRRAMEGDIASLKPVQVIAAGLIGAALFVLTLLAVVRVVIAAAA